MVAGWGTDPGRAGGFATAGSDIVVAGWGRRK